MKVRILKPCINKETGKRLQIGDVIELSKERVENAPKGYVEVVTESATTKPKKSKAKKKVE